MEMQSGPTVNTPEVIQPYAIRLKSALEDPETIEKLFIHVANGGDLITFCKLLNIRFSDISVWITADQYRLKRYSAAAQMGMEWIKSRILNELGSIGMVDIRGLLNESGGLRQPNEWPDDVARAVAGIEVDDLYEGRGLEREKIGETKKIKLTDKLKALELIGKEIGMFVQRSKLEVTTRLEDLVAGSFEDEQKDKPNG